MNKWTADTWIQFGLLMIAELVAAASCIFGAVKFWKAHKNKNPKLEAELFGHIVPKPDGRPLASGIRVRVIHRGGSPVKIDQIVLRVKGRDFAQYIAKGWSSGLGTTPVENAPKDALSMGFRLFRMIGDKLAWPSKDIIIDFSERHEESYFTAFPFKPDLDRWLIDDDSENVEIVAIGPDGEIGLIGGPVVQPILKGLRDAYGNSSQNVEFPAHIILQTVSKTPPINPPMGMSNDRGFSIPPPDGIKE